MTDAAGPAYRVRSYKGALLDLQEPTTYHTLRTGQAEAHRVRDKGQGKKGEGRTRGEEIWRSAGHHRPQATESQPSARGQDKTGQDRIRGSSCYRQRTPIRPSLTPPYKLWYLNHTLSAPRRGRAPHRFNLYLSTLSLFHPVLSHSPATNLTLPPLILLYNLLDTLRLLPFHLYDSLSALHLLTLLLTLCSLHDSLLCRGTVLGHLHSHTFFAYCLPL